MLETEPSLGWNSIGEGLRQALRQTGSRWTGDVKAKRRDVTIHVGVWSVNKARLQRAVAAMP